MQMTARPLLFHEPYGDRLHRVALDFGAALPAFGGVTGFGGGVAGFGGIVEALGEVVALPRGEDTVDAADPLRVDAPEANVPLALTDPANVELATPVVIVLPEEAVIVALEDAPVGTGTVLVGGMLIVPVGLAPRGAGVGSWRVPLT